MFQKNLAVEERIYSGSKYKFLVLGRDEIKNFSAEIPSIVISITDPETAEAAIPKSEFLIDILRLKFHDIGKPKLFDSEKNEDFPISKEQAKQISDFVRNYLDKVELIVCQCEQGVSRSAAIAAALSNVLQNEDEYFVKNYWMNRYVYDILTDALNGQK
jgi:predicted protein tyrosine phosphatase